MLSHHRMGEENNGTQISLKSIRNQYKSVVASAIARYSASVLERATTGCFLAVQEIRHEPKNIPKPVVDQRSSGSPAQSESQNAWRLSLPLVYHKP